MITTNPVRLDEREYAACDDCTEENNNSIFKHKNWGGIIQVYEDKKMGFTLCEAHWEEYAERHGLRLAVTK